MSLTHEVCIVGAGPVGLALANCLARSPLVGSVALVDRRLPRVLPVAHSPPSQRVFSINSPTLRFLDRIGALQRVRQMGSLERIEVISRQSNSFLEWREDAAKIIENDELVNALLLTLNEPPNAKVELIEDEVEAVSNEHYSECEVKLKSRVAPIRTKLLVGSDGNRSRVKQLSGIPTYGWSYRQKAIACTLSVEGLRGEQNTLAYQIFHEANVLGVLPLWGNYLSIVWSLQLPDFEHAMQLPDAQFVHALNALLARAAHPHRTASAFLNPPPFTALANSRLAFPLSSLQAENYAKHRVALIGDAAHSIHPMAGLGVNSGILDGILLANSIIANKRTGNDIGEGLSLAGFEASSKALNYGNSVAMEAIKKLFEVDCAPLNSLRSAALSLAQRTPAFKSLMRGAVERNPLVHIPRYEWEH